MLEYVFTIPYSIPFLLAFKNKKLSCIALALINIINIILSIFTQNQTLTLLLLVSMILILTKKPLDLSWITAVSIGVLLAPPEVVVAMILLFLSITLGLKKKHGRFLVYSTILVVLYLVLSITMYDGGIAFLLLFLAFIFPAHKVLIDIYDSDYFSYILLSSAIILKLANILLEHEVGSITFSTLMILLGIFTSMKSKRFSEFAYSLHLFTIGFLVYAVLVRLPEAFLYTIVSVHALSIVIISLTSEAIGSNDMSDATDYKFSSFLSTISFITFILYFVVVSIISEIALEHSLHEHIILPVGIISIFASAISLVFFFRIYTFIFSSTAEAKNISEGILGKVLAFPVIILLAIVVYESITFLSIINTLLLMIISATLIIGLLASVSIKYKITEPWLLGYVDVKDIKLYGEATPWILVFSKVYKLRIPDEKLSKFIEKVHPAVGLIPLIIFILMEVIKFV